MIQKKALLFTFIKILLSIIVFYIILRSIDIEQFKKVFKSADAVYFSLSLCFLIVSIIIGFFRWNTILTKFRQQKSITQTGAIYSLAFFYNVYVPGGIFGDIVRGYKTANEELSKTSSYTMVLLDRLFGMYGIFGIGLISLFRDTRNIPEILQLITLIAYLALVILPFFFFSKSFRALINKFGKNKATTIFNNSLNVFAEFFRDRKNMIIACLYSLLTGLTNILAFYFAGKAVNINISFIIYMQLIPLVLLVSFIPVTYKGLGLRESIIIILFGYHSINPGTSLAFSIIYSINIFALGLFSAGIYVLFKYILSSNKLF